MNCIERGNMEKFICQVFGHTQDLLTKKTDEEIERLYQRAVVKNEAQGTSLGRFYDERHD